MQRLLPNSALCTLEDFGELGCWRLLLGEALQFADVLVRPRPALYARLRRLLCRPLRSLHCHVLSDSMRGPYSTDTHTNCNKEICTPTVRRANTNYKQRRAGRIRGNFNKYEICTISAQSRLRIVLFYPPTRSRHDQPNGTSRQGVTNRRQHAVCTQTIKFVAVLF